ncbi:MAG TPA: hypothetical protein VEH77_16480 [Roseiarcus sp.]|nr:hypothetical protein [Roseiarcus sp.]
MDNSGDDDRMTASRDDLARMFDKVVASDAFAICVDVSDSAYPAGLATFFSGDRGTYSRICRPFDAGRLPAFGKMLAEAHAALHEVCIVRVKYRRESFCLRPNHAQPGAPASIDVKDARRHPGFLAEGGGFMAIAVPRGEDRGEPLFAIYADEGDDLAKRLWIGHVLWLSWFESLASSFCGGERSRASGNAACTAA